MLSSHLVFQRTNCKIFFCLSDLEFWMLVNFSKYLFMIIYPLLRFRIFSREDVQIQNCAMLGTLWFGVAKLFSEQTLFFLLLPNSWWWIYDQKRGSNNFFLSKNFDINHIMAFPSNVFATCEKPWFSFSLAKPRYVIKLLPNWNV